MMRCLGHDSCVRSSLCLLFIRKGMRTSLVRYEMSIQMKTAKEKRQMWAAPFLPM